MNLISERESSVNSAGPDAASASGRTAAFALVGTVVGAMSNFMVLLLIATTLDKTSVGAFAAIAAVFQLASVLIRLGSDIGCTYSIGRVPGRLRTSYIVPTTIVAVVPVGAGALLLMIIGVVGANPIGSLLAGDADPASYRTMLQIAAIALPANAVGEVLLALTRGFGSMRVTVVANNFGKQTGQLVTVAVTLLVTRRPDMVMLAWALPNLIVLLYPAGWLLRRVREATEPSPPREWASFWRYSSPQAANAGVQGGLEKLDIILLSVISDPGSTAVYSIANRFVHVVVLARYAITVSFSASFAEGFSLGRNDRLQEGIARSGSWGALVTMPVCLLFVLFPTAVMGVVGADYEVGAPALAILTLGVFVSTLFGPSETLLLMSGASFRAFVHNISAFALNILLNVILIPRHGATGAAIAWTVSIILTRALSSYALWRKTTITTQSRALRYASGLSVATIGLVGCIARLLWGDSLSALVIAALGGGALWFVGSYASRDELAIADLFRDRAV